MNIKVDSRKVTAGDTFVALRGISSDGHDYIDTAIKNGSSKLIVEVDNDYSIPYEVVEDTRIYLNNYLKETYKDILNDLTIIGITGTNGKTTSAYLLYNALNNLNLKCSYFGTIGFYIDEKVKSLPNTTPDILDIYELLIESYNNGCKYVVMEVSSQGLSYGRVEGIEFDYAIFTNLTQDHLDYHKTMENYALAKQQLFKQLKNDKIAIINFDDDSKNYYLLNDNHNFEYGFNGGDLKVIDYKMSSQGTIIKYSYKNCENTVKTRLIGKYNIYNCLCVISVLLKLGISHEQISDVFSRLSSPLGRMEIVPYFNNSIIIDYAHTPDAFENVIKTVKEVTIGKIYIVFGCTGDRDRLKRPIMGSLATLLTDYVIITNDDPHNEDEMQIVEDILNGISTHNYNVCLDRRKAIIEGIGKLKDNDTLLILGKGHEEFMVVKDKKIPFQDKKVVLEIIKEKVV